MISNELNEKYNNLKTYISKFKSAAIAYSSGTDSTFLLKTAQEVLNNNVIAITASSCSFPKRELDEAIVFCKENNIRHYIVMSEELDIEGFSKNPLNRCYLCKKELFTKIKKIAKENNIENILEGTNKDDEGDYRPGMLAIQELGIKSPLRYAKLTKQEIRILSEELNLPTSNKPSFACLASRFVYGEEITKEKLQMVDKAEQLLLDLGFKQVRVRIHNLMARIELNETDFQKIIKQNIRQKIIKEFKKLGFTYISLDLQGYRTGSMNEMLSPYE